MRSTTGSVNPSSAAWPTNPAGPTEWNRWFLRRSATPSDCSNPTSGPLIRTPKEARTEAVLFISDSAVSARRLAQLAILADIEEARSLVDRLNQFYQQDASPFRVVEIASGYRLLTQPEFAPWLDKLHHRQTELKLSAPALETLTIVAYRQPIIRADIEAIRGVQSADMLRQLMERGLVRITGEEDTLGRPYLYGTTRKFLETYGLRSLSELPYREELQQAEEPSKDVDEPEPDAEAFDAESTFSPENEVSQDPHAA